MAALIVSEEEFDPKRGIDYIKDPVYHYIQVSRPRPGDDSEVTERHLVDHPWLQRLRRIRQTQATHTVYPGMEHSRFQHSLGVMHLSGRFARHWYSNYLRVRDERIRTQLPSMRLPSVNFVEEVFRLAGLLHDVGHGPYSHTLDTAYKTYFKGEKVIPTHEDISKEIIIRELGSLLSGIARSPSGPFDKGEAVDPRMIAWLVKPTPGSYTDAVHGWLNRLKTIITGFYCADTLDYLVRDAYHGGTLEYGTIDVERLIHTSFMTEKGICIHGSSTPALSRMLHARLQAYETCYFHKTVRAHELIIQELLVRTLAAMRLPSLRTRPSEFLRKYYDFDEYYLVGQAVTWSRSKRHKQLGKEWLALLNRRIALKQFYSSEERPSSPTYAWLLGTLPIAFRDLLKTAFSDWKSKGVKELRKEGLSRSAIDLLKGNSYEQLQAKIRFDSPALDVRRINPQKDESSVTVYDRLTRRTSFMSIVKAVQEFPMKIVAFRAFAPPKMNELLSFIAMKAASKLQPIVQDSSF